MTEPLNPEVAILNAALELPAEQRASYLDEACAGDRALRRQVEALLRAHEQAADFLETPLAGLHFDRTSPIPLKEKPGDRVGRYKLLQQIGEGGCGVVYMAEQEEPVRRRVALKVIKLGMDTKQVIARFEAERQALALMDHPNIARVLDAGATEAGRPYFVMELVRGVRITEFCDANNVSTQDRLKLFIQVCQAIQHAHQKGVIHRDVKPSNILVTVNDGVPVPKVIDFGIAKATQGRLTDQTLFTAFEQFIGTPAYMSPEQAVMTSLDIDTRSDIYSLGVLLYELLTSRTPFDQTELLAAGLDEMRRTIREKEPPRPSTRLSTMAADALTATARQRHTDVPMLIHLVHGDLDWIVMKCLEKDRARRYETANGLARDIERHLKNEPVTARPPTRLYRFRKLLRRNKLTFAAAAAIAVALVAVALGSTVAAWRVAGARRAEHRERQKAETANRDLRQTINLLELERTEDFFSAHDSAAGVAHLAAMLRRDPSNSIAANRLVSALTHRNWALPGTRPMRHSERVIVATFSPDGRHVLSASWDRTARIWDAASGQTLFTLHHDDRVLSARYSLNGQRIVTAAADGTARVWDAVKGAAVTPALRHSNTVNWAEFSRDGALVVTAGADKVARIWNAVTGELDQELRGHSRPILVARFSPDGKLVATGTDWGGLRLWSVESGKLLFRLAGHRNSTRLESLAFSPDGHQLVSAGYDRTARLWNVATAQPIGEPLVHRWRVWQAEFSPDSKLLLTTCEDGMARLWDAHTLRPVTEPLRHESGVIFGEFSPDGQSVVTTSSDNTARVWDVRIGMPLCQPLRHIGRVFYASFSPDGRRLATASYDGKAQIWNFRERLYAPAEIHHEHDVTSVAFSPDGNALLTGSRDRTARLWNARTAQPLGEPLRHSSEVFMAAFSPDGLRIVTASASRTNRVWDANTGRVIAGPFYHTEGLRVAQFSPDGEHVLTASVDGTARVWNARTAEPITPPLTHQGPIVFARFSPDGRLVLTASEDHTARVWDAQTGQAVTEPLAHRDHVKWADFSPDGKRVATASTDDTACIWDIRTSRRAAPPLEHTRTAECIAFSPDGQRVASGSLDRTARIWDANTGQALTPPLQHDSTVSRVRFSPDGRRILTTCWNAKARVWDADTGRALTEWLHAGESVMDACFDSTGERIAIGARAGIATIWNVPLAPTPVPEWFPNFAEAVAGIRLGVRGNVELVPRTELDQTAQRLPLEGSGDFYERLARWFLADPSARSAASF